MTELQLSKRLTVTALTNTALALVTVQADGRNVDQAAPLANAVASSLAQLVVRAESTPKDAVVHALTELHEGHVTVPGVVLNALRRGTYDYHYYPYPCGGS